MLQNKPLPPIDRCKLLLEEFLQTSSDIVICSKQHISSIDAAVLRYLLKVGHKEFLVTDVSHGPQVGGLSEAALYDFAVNEKVFDGKLGRF